MAGLFLGCFYQFRFESRNLKLKHIIVEGHPQLQIRRILIVFKPINQKSKHTISECPHQSKNSGFCLHIPPSVPVASSYSGLMVFQIRESWILIVFTPVLLLVHTIWDPNWILFILDNRLDVVNCTINSIVPRTAKCAGFAFTIKNNSQQVRLGSYSNGEYPITFWTRRFIPMCSDWWWIPMCSDLAALKKTSQRGSKSDLAALLTQSIQ